MTKRILCLHGPNLNMLGIRQPEIYGASTLAAIDEELQALSIELKVSLTVRQHNHEGQLVDWIQEARGDYDALLFNPAGYTHTSVALRDAVILSELPLFEVHLSNVYAREPFRHHSYFADIAVGRVIGFGPAGYMLALRGATEYLSGVK